MKRKLILLCALCLAVLLCGGCGQQQTQTGTTGQTEEIITADQAKEKALAHAGLTNDQATFARCELDLEDGRQVYEVEFTTQDNKEYDYEIDPYTGEILRYDYDAEHAAASGGSTVTEEQAKALALAKVPGATASDIKEFKTDQDHDRTEYEGRIVYNGTEYEFEINSATGDFLKWEEEPAH